MKNFTHYKQLDSMDCGPICLRMVAKHYGRSYSTAQLREMCEIGKDGVNLLGIAQAAERIGFKTLGVKITLQKLIEDAPLPCIVHWGQNHFVVVVSSPLTPRGGITNGLRDIWGGRNARNNDLLERGKHQNNNHNPHYTILVADPAAGMIEYSAAEFESRWASTTDEDGQKVGVALLLEKSPAPRPPEGELENAPSGGRGAGLWGLLPLLLPYKPLIVQLFLGLLVGSILQLVLPFLTQSVVDTGIQTRNLNFITLVLVAQLVLFVGRMSVEFIRSWILLHISTRINLTILSDFLSKLLRLPISFFDSKQTGDIMQRIGDHERIEQFLTGTSLNTLFSLFNLVIFSVVLAHYNMTVFGVFVLASVLYTAWVMLFLRYRRQLDNKRFALASQNQSSLIQLIQGIQDIKLNNAEHLKRWQWENLQVRSFKLNLSSLAVGQFQQAGAMFINESKNIFISFLAATAVINGQMTLGGMMALQYIIGQLNGPIEQFIQFIQHWQDAKISLERLNEVHELEDEDSPARRTVLTPRGGIIVPPLGVRGLGLHLQNLTFTYPGAGNEPVLKNINLTIPQGKVTAIVGSSGSGKTTLLKLLLRFYSPLTPSGGTITPPLGVGGLSQWREKCGSVMQDGYIFSDSIANNIAIGDETVDVQKLFNAVRVANIHDFIESLPLGYNTKIGSEGNGISGGQKQRILIARAVYKDPEYLFFDEATSSLDASNEAVIVNNLNEFFRGNTIAGTDLKSVSHEYGILNPTQHKKTVVVVAHRLSTVKNADQIVVLEQGEVVEIGTHQELTAKRGKYYELVKNQLELGV
jgi:ATP-binding cassette, subfamily B, bacterial